MSSAVKAAKQSFAGLLRVPRRSGKAAMIAVLIRIAEYLETIAAIDADAAARAAFGAAHLGLATDVDAALAAVDWAARVRSTFPQSVGVGAGAAAALLSGNPDRLRAVRALAGRPQHKMLQAQLPRFSSSTGSFGDLANRLDGLASGVEALALVCKELGVPERALASDLPAIVDALQSTAHAETASRLPPALGSVSHGNRPSPLADDGPFDAALRLASAVGGLGLPQPVCEALWRTPPNRLQTAAVPAALATVAALTVANERWVALSAQLGLDENRLSRPTGGRGYGRPGAGPACVRSRLSGRIGGLDFISSGT